MDRDEAAFRVVSSLYRILHLAATTREADIVLIDVGPNLGALNRSAILAADAVVVPLAADLYSLQGLKNLGPTLHEWRDQWRDRLGRRPSPLQLDLPTGEMKPLGYIVLQHAVRMDRPVKAYERWMARIPNVYKSAILEEAEDESLTVLNDSNCLASLKHYRSLMPLAQDALKPMFHLKAADGALGSHLYAVQECDRDFKNLTSKIAEAAGIAWRSSESAVA